MNKVFSIRTKAFRADHRRISTKVSKAKLCKATSSSPKGRPEETREEAMETVYLSSDSLLAKDSRVTRFKTTTPHLLPTLLSKTSPKSKRASKPCRKVLSDKLMNHPTWMTSSVASASSQSQSQTSAWERVKEAFWVMKNSRTNLILLKDSEPCSPQMTKTKTSMISWRNHKVWTSSSS